MFILCLFSILFGYLTCPLLYFCAFWKKNPAEGRVLSCEIWMKRTRCGVFKPAVSNCDSLFMTVLYAHAFFGRKVHTMKDKETTYNESHVVSCKSSEVWAYLRICHVQKQRIICKYVIDQGIYKLLHSSSEMAEKDMYVCVFLCVGGTQWVLNVTCIN